jgi:PhoPQ-activated pathogenicity-related protein
MRKVLSVLSFFLFIQTLVTFSWAEETALDRYVAKSDDSYLFTHYHTEQDLGFITYFITMTSQQWRTSPNEVDRAQWEHDLMITVPWSLRLDTNTAILFIDGGSNDGVRPTSPDQTLSLIALLTRLPVVRVRQIPNQPLYFADQFGQPRTGDAILAYSLDKFLDGGDEEWPVHLPMVKAVVRAIDTAQEFLAQRFIRVDDFILYGGSKRGWTTWLTAAVEPRVKAMIPASFDVLNMEPQMDRHWEAYGFYSDALKDYREFDVFCRGKLSPDGEALRKIIDPYEYRERYAGRPKLVINSTGDQFFLPDSSQLYFKELPEPKYLRYTPNTDHGQSQQREESMLAAISWAQDIINGRPGPQFTWSFEDDSSIRVETQTNPKRVRLWQVTNPTARHQPRDFRFETLKSMGLAWTSSELQEFQVLSNKRVYVGSVEVPQEGWTAFMVELTFEEGSVLKADQVYTTDVRIVPEMLPFAGEHCVSLLP